MTKAFRPQRSGAQAGFSLIEAMIAALLLLIVILGILPLVSRSLLNNLQGNDASNETNASVDGIERLLSLPFDNIAMEVPTGQMSLVAQDFFLLNGNAWASVVPSGDSAQYVRSATVDQFSAADLDTDDKLDTPEVGGTAPEFIHLKRITMDIENGRHYFTTTTAYRVIAVQSY